jgi:hypothetical protein
MITIKAIFNNDNTASPESIPKFNFGSNFDGENYYYFESEEEKKEYYETLDKE